MAATMSAETIIIDDRPLKERLSEALKEREVGHKAALTLATVSGGAAGAGIAYVNYVISMAFYGWIQMPAWFMTIATYSGYFAIAYLGIGGAWLGYNWVKNSV